MTAENSRPNPHGYKSQPTFQQDDMNREEESKTYGVFIDQSRKYLNNEILAMKALFSRPCTSSRSLYFLDSTKTQKQL
jgi:hypothetical protein